VRPNETDEISQPLLWVAIPAMSVTHGEMVDVAELAEHCAAEWV
jgi:hypothetical protein